MSRREGHRASHHMILKSVYRKNKLSALSGGITSHNPSCQQFEVWFNTFSALSNPPLRTETQARVMS